MKDDELTIEILDATVSDAAKILEIQRLAFRGQAILYNDFTLPPLIQTIEELVRDFERHSYLKAVSGGKIVGSVRGRVEGGTCFISRLSVHPGYQNKGIGKRLMRAIEEKFNDVRRYELFTGHKSEKNLALYGKLGYREYKRSPQGDKVMLVFMEKNA